MSYRLEKYKRKWQEGVESEIEFWDNWMQTKGSEWPDDFAFRINPDSAFQEYLVKYLPQQQARVSILDVGSGPLTWLGKKHPDQRTVLEITATDPLADQYSVLLRRNNLDYTVAVKSAFSEDLGRHFSESSFDFVYMRNALDHSYDPLISVGEMIRLVVRGGFIVLEHETNEAVNEQYHGLHQWNICVEDGAFILWNKGSRYVVNEHFGEEAIISCHASDGYNLIEIQKKR